MAWKIYDGSITPNFSAEVAALQEGDVLVVERGNDVNPLFINLQSTAEITARGVKIMGNNAIIRPDPGFAPGVSPLIRIAPPNGTPPPAFHLRNVELDSLHLWSNANAGTGTGTAVEILSRTLSAYTSAIRLNNCRIDNFTHGVYLDDVWDIFLDNCTIQDCENGIYMTMTSATPNGMGQLKLYGGTIQSNRFGIHCTAPSGTGALLNMVSLFGVSFGHCRGECGQASGIAVLLAHPSQLISAFGCHFEDLSNAIYANATIEVGDAQQPMCLSLFGNVFQTMNPYNGTVNTNDILPGNRPVDGVTYLGNHLGTTFIDGAVRRVKALAVPSLNSNNDGGLIYAGNAWSDNPDSAARAQNQLPAQKMSPVYPTSTIDDFQFPPAGYLPNEVPVGMTVFHRPTTKLYINDGTTWRQVQLT